MDTSCGVTDIEARVRHVLADMRARRDDVASALRGRSLRVQIVVVAGRSVCVRVLLTAAGNAVVISGPAHAHEPFEPDVLLVGTRGEVHGYLIGAQASEAAAREGNLVCFGVAPQDLEPLRLLVAELLGGSTES